MTLDDFQQSATTIESFFVTLGYPIQLVQEGRRKAASTPRALLLAGRNANQTGTNRVPMVTTYHPKNALLRSYRQARSWDDR